MSKKISHWLLKTEPETFSFDQLIKDQKTHWNGVRNFQARNFLKQASLGDWVLIYHSGDERAAVGLAQVVREAYPDLDPDKPGEWVQIDIEVVKRFTHPVELKRIKAEPRLKELLLIRQSRLSVMPVSQEHFDILLEMAT